MTEMVWAVGPLNPRLTLFADEMRVQGSHFPGGGESERGQRPLPGRLQGVQALTGSSKRILSVLLGLLLCVAAGCGKFHVDPTWERLSVAQVRGLADRQWSEGPGVWHVQQTVFLESRGHELLMSGFVRLDTAGRTARVVAMNELGMKFFDLEVSEAGLIEHFTAPDIKRFPEVAAMLAESVRHIYLVPRLTPDTPVWLAPYGPVARGEWQGVPAFTFLDPATGEPVRKMSPDKFWTVDYREYRREEPRSFPGSIVYTHTRAGLRLTLRTNKVSAQ